MRKRWGGALLALAICVTLQFLFGHSASALAVKIQPLLYNDTLSAGEKKKGFVDVSNPTAQSITLNFYVQAFRQTDDNGSLQFYDDPQVTAGLIPDLKEVILEPHAALRLYFLVDGTKLPTGDVFAGLFAQVQPVSSKVIYQTVAVGTLFTIVNGTPGPRKAEVTDLNVPFWQLGTTVSGEYQVKNTADASKATGFYPDVQVQLRPYGQSRVITASLVFAGRTRTSTFKLPVWEFGLYRLTASYGGSMQSRWVFIANWWWIGSMIFVLFVYLAYHWVNERFRNRKKRRDSQHFQKKRK